MDVKDLTYEHTGKKHGLHFTLPPLTPGGKHIDVSIWGNSKQEAFDKMDAFLKQPEKNN